MEWFISYMLFSSVVLLYIAYWYLSSPKNLPPGTAGVPFLGYLPFTRKGLPKILSNLGKKYGAIYHVYMGKQIFIILNNFDVIKEAFVKNGDAFSGRPSNGLQPTNEWFKGIVFTDGEFWKQHRRFLLQNLKNNGVGKHTMEPLILDEIQHLLKEIRKRTGNGEGKVVNLKNILSISLANIIQLLLSGKRYDYEEPLMNRMLESLNEITKLHGIIQFAMIFSWAKPIFTCIFYKYTRKAERINHAIQQLMINTVLEAKKNYSSDRLEGSYLNSYITERQKRLKDNKNESIFTEKGMITNSNNLFVAGTDTSATTLTWAALFMAANPDVQKRVELEIEQFIGDREPSYNDRTNTPFTEATIYEIHRIVSLVPISIPHKTMNETELLGYTIPKAAIVIPNLWAVHHDTKLWGDPHNFRPERFLNSNGECVKPEYLIPFSIGKRACAGESLARMELYLYFVSLLQNFTFSGLDGKTPSLKAKYLLLNFPKSDLICIAPKK